MNQPLWQPNAAAISHAEMTKFRLYIQKISGKEIADWQTLYDWSVENIESFWDALWDYCEVIGDKGKTILQNSDKIEDALFFPEARLNYAENMLRFSSLPEFSEKDAIVFWGEDKVKRRLTHNEMMAQIAKLAAHFRAIGLQPGDRIAAFIPCMPESVIGAMAAAAIGCIWSSCSPDFGIQGVLDRFGQIEPKILIAADGYWYNGKSFDSLGRLKEILPKLPSIEEILIVPYLHAEPDLSALPKARSITDIIQTRNAAPLLEYTRVPFNHPLFVMYSSGTTGVPKCIVHGQGGTLLQHLKEHRLHSNIRPHDRISYFTTCGWMMWNWLISGIGSGATLLLFDGSPFSPNGNILYDYAQAEKCTLFGTSAKYIDACAKAGLEPIKSHNLETIRTICSTGSPLSPESFDYVYRSIKKDVCLSSISGGTDIISCFMLGNPIAPVWRGEIQMRGLGMKVQVWDENGKSVMKGKGELVCVAPFPCMPIGFWNDPEGEKYHAAYFAKYSNIWHHGDWVELTDHGGIIVYGRSDAVLNPGGVRIGTAEIYRQVEQLEEILESIVIGQDWDNDVRVVLFVRLKAGTVLDEPLKDKIKKQIRANTTPRHVPARIIAINDIPRTKSGKIVELAVRDIVHGRIVKNNEALANPEALDLFRDITELRS